jgi:hypothetical protein
MEIAARHLNGFWTQNLSAVQVKMAENQLF